MFAKQTGDSPRPPDGSDSVPTSTYVPFPRSFTTHLIHSAECRCAGLRLTVRARFWRRTLRQSRSSIVSALDLERLCSFCRYLAPQEARRPQGLLKRYPAATPPTWGRREHVSCFSLFTISMRSGKAKTRITVTPGASRIALAQPRSDLCASPRQAAKRRHVQGQMLKGSISSRMLERTCCRPASVPGLAVGRFLIEDQKADWWRIAGSNR